MSISVASGCSRRPRIEGVSTTSYSPAHCAMRRPKLAVRGIAVGRPVITGRASVWSRRGLLSVGGCLVIRLNGYRSRRERECSRDQGSGKIEGVQSHLMLLWIEGCFDCPPFTTALHNARHEGHVLEVLDVDGRELRDQFPRWSGIRRHVMQTFLSPICGEMSAFGQLMPKKT